MVVGREVASQAVSKVDVENKNVVDSVCVFVSVLGLRSTPAAHLILAQ